MDKLTLLTISVIFSFLGTQVNASPILSNSFIYFQQLNFNDGIYETELSTNTFADRSTLSGVSAYGDLSTGRVGSQVLDNALDYQSIVSMYDTLTFDSNANIGFSFTLDGTLTSNSIFSTPNGQGRIDIYDITGLSNWAETHSVLGLFDVDGFVAEAIEVSSNRVLIDMDEINIGSSSLGGGNTTIPNPLSRDGTLHDVSYTLSGSFNADASKTYAIRLTAGATTGADFLNTGTFRFTDLDGATFTSGSGVFLNSSAVSVPEPSVFWLTVIGLFGLFYNRGKYLTMNG